MKSSEEEFKRDLLRTSYTCDTITCAMNVMHYRTKFDVQAKHWPSIEKTSPQQTLQRNVNNTIYFCVGATQ